MFKELLNPEGQILVLESKASPNFESAKPNEAVPEKFLGHYWSNLSPCLLVKIKLSS